MNKAMSAENDGKTHSEGCWKWHHDCAVMHLTAAKETIRDLQSSLAEKDETIVALRQAIWDTFAILGGDTDGDKTPDAMVSPPLPDFIRTFARETRKDYDDACAELANMTATGKHGR
jgi:hypothetical protein